MTARPGAPRTPLVAANWKMNLLRSQAADYCRILHDGGARLRAVEAIVFPSFPLIPAVVSGLAGSGIAVGGQDLHPEGFGAHTGDVSGPQLADAGCAWVLCGHSERRRDHGESDELVGQKAAAARRAGLAPMICVGETGEERRAGETFRVLERQLAAALAGLLASSPADSPADAAAADRFALAYEPVWAIGTGATATAETAQEVHRHLREALGRELGETRAAALRILYGGSVTPDNAAGLDAEPDVDGFLIGGASLDPRKFLSIMTVCAA
jgi:triosephosphate isomerase